MKIRKVVSLIVVTAMLVPSLASVAEAAVVTWLSPQEGLKLTARNVEIAVGYNTQSDLEVTRLELYVDSKLYSRRDLVRPESRGVCSFWWNTTKYSDGPHDLLIKVFAGDTLISKVTSSGTVGNTAWDSEPPTVAFANIKSGDVLKGTYDIKLNAKDDSGNAPLVSLLVDNHLKLVKNTKPYNYSLDTKTYSDGSHEIQTYAYDSSGNKSKPAVVKVSFKNNLQRPVVAPVEVTESAVPAVSEDDGNVVIEEAVAPVEKVAPAETVAPKSDASRAADGAAKVICSAKPAAPLAVVARAEKPAAVKAAPPAVKVERTAKAPVVMAKLPDAKSDTESWALIHGLAVKPKFEKTPNVKVTEVHKTGQASGFFKKTKQADASKSAKLIAKEIATAAALKAKKDKVAVAAFVNDVNAFAKMKHRLQSTQSAKVYSPAKLEKKTIPVSGKIKMRDLFDKLGGVLFWDAELRVVIAYVGDMQIQMQIGSKVALVDGKEMMLSEAPLLAEGRVIVDAQVYHQALAFNGGMDQLSLANVE